MDKMQVSSTAPHLTNREVFEAVLADYHISDRAKQAVAKTKLVLLAGPSAAGRNTVINYLVARKNYHYIISDTTRPPRVNKGIPEQNGREYWFRTEEEILEDLKKGEFLEAEIIHKQQVSGISIRELERATEEHKVAINEVEIGGFQTVLQAIPATIAIFLLPPSFEEWQQRLVGRGEMTPSELKNRLETAVLVFTGAVEANYGILVINDAVEHAAEQIDRIVQGHPVDQSEQQHARELARQLLEKTTALLGTL